MPRTGHSVYPVIGVTGMHEYLFFLLKPMVHLVPAEGNVAFNTAQRFFWSLTVAPGSVISLLLAHLHMPTGAILASAPGIYQKFLPHIFTGKIVMKAGSATFPHQQRVTAVGHKFTAKLYPHPARRRFPIISVYCFHGLPPLLQMQSFVISYKKHKYTDPKGLASHRA